MRWINRKKKRYEETLVRIAGTPTKNSSKEAKEMAQAANDVLRKRRFFESGE